MVASYTWGIDADRFDGLSDDDIVDQVLEDLSDVHDRDLEFLKKNLREGVVKRWANDPYTLGAFAMFAPYQVRFCFLLIFIYYLVYYDSRIRRFFFFTLIILKLYFPKIITLILFLLKYVLSLLSCHQIHQQISNEEILFQYNSKLTK